MSTLERQALDGTFRNWKDLRMPDAKESDAFEIFTAELILKDLDLSDAEIANGISGGGGDAGVDGLYFFVDRVLIQSDEYTPKGAQNVRLDVIQSTTSPGFQENKIDKMEKFCRYLLDWGDLADKKTIRQLTREQMLRFRAKYTDILASPHSLTVNLFYASKSEHPPAANLLRRVDELKDYIKSKLNLAKVEFHPWGCKQLLTAHQKSPEKTLVLECVKKFATADTSVVCVCSVANYAKFLDDGEGNIRTWMMEPNVRDYQGNTKVNKQIRGTLNSATWTEDFWWLNNGVTILADSCSETGDFVRIENPEVVNGLQTSYEIFDARGNAALTKRNLLVKVIVARDDKSKTAIIKATNSQTSVSTISLKATEPLQFAIEEELREAGLFYDRRKGKYRRLKKPLKNIVSMSALAQAVIAAYLQFPSDARGRPDSIATDEKRAVSVFNEEYDLKIYRACIVIDRRCQDFVQASHLKDDEKTDLRYYVTMLATCDLCGRSQPKVEEIVATIPSLSTALTDAMLKGCLDVAMRFYIEHGATDKTAKGREMEDAVKRDLAVRYT